MTSPENVGTVSVDLIADGKALGASIRKEIEGAFKGLDFDKLLRQSLGDKPIKIPVTPDWGDNPFKDAPKPKAPKAPKTKAPEDLPTEEPAAPKAPKSLPKTKAPVEVDPLFDAFRSQLKQELAASAKELHASIPVDADTDGLRAELGAQLAEVAKQLKLPIPAEPGDKAAFQAKLQEQLDDVRSRVKAQVKVEPDTADIPAKVRATPVPKVKVEVDPLLSAFQSEMQSQVRALAKTVNAKIPLDGDTAGLRAKLGAELAEIQRSMKADIPTEPGSRAEYEAKLKAQLEEVSKRVKQNVKVDPDTKGDSGVGGLLGKLSDITQSVPGLGLVSSAIGGIAQAATGAATIAGQLGGSLAGGLSEAAGPIGAVISGLLAVTGAAAAMSAAIVGGVTFAIPAITALAGAIAALPGLLAGVGAGAGTLLLGFKGVGDALSTKPKAGSGANAAQQAAQQARQVAAAQRQLEAARRGAAAADRAYEASERSLAAAQRGVVTAQRAAVDAEQALVDAQHRAAQAQIAVNKARQEAADDLVDLNLQLKGSQLSEQEATLAVSDALRALNAAKLTGVIPDIQAADLAYQRAQLTLEQNTQQTKELGAQTADANQKGVEGSDKVQAALQEQHDALEGVHKAQEGVTDAQNGIIDAADSLKSAQDGMLSAQDGIKSAADSLASAQDSLAEAQTKQATSAAAAAAQMVKLAPAAQKFVDAVKALKPAFDNLRLDVQQKLFEGLDKTVTQVGKAWIPALKETLGNYAITFNGFFKDLGNSISTPTFISDIQTGAEGARQGFEKIGTSISTNLVPAFGKLVRAAGPFLSNLGGDIAKGLDKFSGFIDRVSKPDKDGTSQLTRFFDRASTAMHEIFEIGGTVAKIIGGILGIITGSSPTSDKESPLVKFKNGLQKIADFLNTPTTQKKIQDFIGKVTDAVNRAYDLAGKVAHIYESIKSAFGGNSKDPNSSLWASIGAGIVTGIIAGLAGMAELIWSFLRAGFKAALQRLKDFLGIHSPSTVFAEIGGNIVDGLTSGISGALSGLLDTVGQIPGLVIGAVGDAASWLVVHGENAVAGLMQGIGAMLGNLGTFAGNLKTTVMNKLSDAGTWLVAHGGNAVIGLINGIGGRLSSLATSARNIATTVLNGLGSIYNQMLSIGSNIIVGLYNGIVSMGSWLYSRLVSFIKAVVPGPIAAALGIASPSKVAHQLGRYVGQGLADGIDSQQQRVSAAADRIAAAALPQFADPTLGFGAAADVALSASLQAASQHQMQVSWNTGATFDPVLIALQNLINVRFRGNVQAALTGA